MKRGISSPAERDNKIFDEVFATTRVKQEHPELLIKNSILLIFISI